jgi:hypothetical protein
MDDRAGSGIPRAGAFAASILLDAVASQGQGLDIRAMEVALSAYESFDGEIDESDLMGAAIACIGWLTARLADATGTDADVVISDARAFIASLGR